LVSLFSVVLSILLSLLFIFSFQMGIFGLALAFSISNLLNFLFLLFLFQFKKEKFISQEEIVGWLKMIFASAMTAFLTWISMRLLDTFVFETSHALPLLFLTIISGSTGVLTYLGLSKILRLKELETIFSIGRKMSQWRRPLVSMEEIIEPHSETSRGI